jgi:hypothetical protein
MHPIDETWIHRGQGRVLVGLIVTLVGDRRQRLGSRCGHGGGRSAGRPVFRSFEEFEGRRRLVNIETIHFAASSQEVECLLPKKIALACGSEFRSERKNNRVTTPRRFARLYFVRTSQWERIRGRRPSTLDPGPWTLVLSKRSSISDQPRRSPQCKATLRAHSISLAIRHSLSSGQEALQTSPHRNAATRSRPAPAAGWEFGLDDRRPDDREMKTT